MPNGGRGTDGLPESDAAVEIAVYHLHFELRGGEEVSEAGRAGWEIAIRTACSISSELMLSASDAMAEMLRLAAETDRGESQIRRFNLANSQKDGDFDSARFAAVYVVVLPPSAAAADPPCAQITIQI